MIHFQVEPWADIRDLVAPLWREHYEEIAHDKERIPLDPDWERYDDLDAKGHLHIVTARDGCELVGYAFAFLHWHIHYKTTLFANYDIFWIRKRYSFGIGRTLLLRKLLRTLEASLFERGVQKLQSNIKTAHDIGVLFERDGWRETERVYTKMAEG